MWKQVVKQLDAMLFSDFSLQSLSSVYYTCTHFFLVDIGWTGRCVYKSNEEWIPIFFWFFQKDKSNFGSSY